VSRSQVDRILAMLRQGPVCGTTFLEAYMPRYAARIYDLRAAGHVIKTSRCQNLYHDHDTAQIVYELDESARDQLSLTLELGD
jgi:hypothetical protein